MEIKKIKNFLSGAVFVILLISSCYQYFYKNDYIVGNLTLIMLLVVLLHERLDTVNEKLDFFLEEDEEEIEE